MNESILNPLNPAQREAASTIDEHVRIIAGAGSGKTRVLMARIAYLIEEIGIPAYRILAITFTNKAANEMRDRLYAQLGEESREVRISTIHALCVRILREDGLEIGYPKSFAILDPDDQKSILKKIYKYKNFDKEQVSLNEALSYISNCKSADVPVEQAKQVAFSSAQKIQASVYEEYEKERKEIKAMDFDDLLIETNRLLKTMPDVKRKWQNRFDYLHVDEFQDVDPIQYSIIKNLCSEEAFVCVVGDPDQTIYTWRGASVEIILQFDRDFSPCKTVILNENYRSTQPILEASNALIANNANRIKKDLFTHLPGEEEVVLHETMEENDEPLFVARQITKFHKQGLSYQDMAVLYRSNYLSRPFEKAFRTIGIPYRIYGGIRFYERQEIKDILSYLRLCTDWQEEDPQQLSLDLSLKRIINTPKRGIGAKTLDKLEDQAVSHHQNMLSMIPESDIQKASKKKLMGFYQLIEELKALRKEVDLLDFFDQVVEKSGYKQMLEDKKEEERLENVMELKEDIHQALLNDPDLTLESYLQDVALFTDKSQEESGGGISLMTVHAAKGLEFPVVFITALNEGVFPSRRTLDEDGKQGLEEERRLMYVAMTRAKNHLILSWNKGYSYRLAAYKSPSRFIQELPQKTGAKEESMISSSRKEKSKTNYRKGDLVKHTIYGEGVIIQLTNDVATIAFSHPHGVKKIAITHPSIQKA